MLSNVNSQELAGKDVSFILINQLYQRPLRSALESKSKSNTTTHMKICRTFELNTASLHVRNTKEAHALCL